MSGRPRNPESPAYASPAKPSPQPKFPQIGRMAQRGFFDTFLNSLDSYLADFDFHVDGKVSAPCIIYLDAHRLPDQADRSILVHQLLEANGSPELLFGNVSLPLDRITIRTRKAGQFTVNARVLDLPHDQYPEGYLISGELALARQTWGIKQSNEPKQASDGPPSLTLKLGHARAGERLSRDVFESAAREMVGEKLVLEGLNLVNTELRPT